ncbi:MAG: type II secretion system protein J [bacterium]
MKKTPQRGLTLLELLIAISLMGVIGVLCAHVLSIAMKSWDVGSRQNQALHEACWALDHIVKRARFSNQLLIPTAIDPTGDTLSFSAMVDTDGDGLIDEDPTGDSNNDGLPGIGGKDDDGDGSIDEGGALAANDDDEDAAIDEDPVEIWDYFIIDGKLIEKYRTTEETEILVEGVTDFRIERVGDADYTGATVGLTITDSYGGERSFQTCVFLRGLHFDPNTVL